MDGGQAEWTPEKQSRAIGVEQSGFKSNQRDSERIKASQPIWGRASSVMTRAVLTGTVHLTHDARSMRESFAITSARPRLGGTDARRAYGSSRSHRTRFPFLGAGSRRGSPSTRSTSFVTESYYQHRALERWPCSPRRSRSPHPPPHLVNKMKEREKKREREACAERACHNACGLSEHARETETRTTRARCVCL